MIKQLNGWQRIGVIVSVLWVLRIAVSAVSFVRPHIYDPDSLSFLESVSCLLGGPPHVVVIFVAAVIPIAGGWLLIYAVIKTVKWVAGGFNLKRSI